MDPVEPVDTVERKIILSHDLPKPFAPYSHGVQLGNVLYISGQLGVTRDREVVEGFNAQARLALDNIGYVLKAAGADYGNVVKVNVLLSDINHFNVMNAIYSEYFKDNLPARAAYQVTALPKNTLIEITAEAVVGRIVESTT